MRVAAINPGESISEAGVGEVRETNGFFGLTGYAPLHVIPRTVDEVARVLALSNERGLKVVPMGSGTKQDRGAPPAVCDILLDLSEICGVVEHAAGDMTVTVRAGTPLNELQQELAKAKQFLAIDPPFPGTVGGLIATGDSGPRRLRYGGVRDTLLGLTFVRADGTVAKAGSKVVKNVAGYDLPKLFTGSLGTLGVIVETTWRLYPSPAASRTVVCKDVDVTQAAACCGQLLSSGLTPTIIDYHAEGDKGVLAARFESSPSSVEGQALAALQLLGQAETLTGEPEQALWGPFDSITATSDGDVLARLITTRSDLPRLLRLVQAYAKDVNQGMSVRAHMGHGHALIRLHEPERDTALQLLRVIRNDAEACQSSLVIWRAPQRIRAQIDMWGEEGEGLALMRQVKRQFDPNTTLNPGRFVGGI